MVAMPGGVAKSPCGDRDHGEFATRLNMTGGQMCPLDSQAPVYPGPDAGPPSGEGVSGPWRRLAMWRGC